MTALLGEISNTESLQVRSPPVSAGSRGIWPGGPWSGALKVRRNRKGESPTSRVSSDRIGTRPLSRVTLPGESPTLGAPSARSFLSPSFLQAPALLKPFQMASPGARPFH